MEWSYLLAGLAVGYMVSWSPSGALLFGLIGLAIALGQQRRNLERRVDQLAELLALTRRQAADATAPAVGKQRSDPSAAEPSETATIQTEEQYAREETPAPQVEVPTPRVETTPDADAASITLPPLPELLALVEPSGPPAGTPAAADIPVAENSESPRATPETAPAAARGQARHYRSAQEPDGPADRLVAWVRDWLWGGNPVVRIGVVLLFLGLAFLLKYVAQRVVLPIELRYAGVALTAMALLAIGWRLRERNPPYARILQGAGIAVMYLTVFAAQYLHALLSPPLAFTLLVAVTLCAAVIAVAQDALALAVVATLGGFATPWLTNTAAHVPLFGYFVLLNAGISGIAWKKAWRSLNVIGFVGTFGTMVVWTGSVYTPDLFNTTEPFLVIFFLMYVAIGLLFARRKLLEARDGQAARQADYVDGTLLFGTPLVGFGLQYTVISHIEYAAAFSALALGLMYMSLARLLYRRADGSVQLLVEVYLALGVIFGTLAIPLGLDARWTSAAWAVEGAGIYWIGVRQERTPARAFALLLQMTAAIIYLSTISAGETTLLDAPWLGALLVGAAFLFSHAQARRIAPTGQPSFDRDLAAPLAVIGLAFLYLLPPIFFATNGTALVWALAGLVTLHVGLRRGELSFVGAAVVVQLIGGALFLLHVQPADPGDSLAALDAGWRGFLFASLIGVSLLASMVMAVRHPLIRDDRVLLQGASVLLLAALVLLNVGVLFVLSWPMAAGVWAGSGLLILWLSLQLRQRAGFVFGVALQVVGGTVFLWTADLLTRGLSGEGLTPLAHTGFWTPATLALAAFVAAWRLRDYAARGTHVELGADSLMLLSHIALGWGAAWWVLTAMAETTRFVASHLIPQVLLLIAAGSVAIWMVAALRVQWRALSILCLALVPCSALVLLAAWHGNYHPASDLGWLAWPAVFVVHLSALKKLRALLPGRLAGAFHVLGVWLLTAVLALELRYVLMLLSEHYNAWRWLGWAAVPSAYLLTMAAVRSLPWPVAEYGREYRAIAASPMAALLLLWVWLAAAFSNGGAEPLPYVPLVNPLELGMLLVLLAIHRWAQAHLLALGLKAPNPQHVHVMLGATLFAVITTGVFRAAFHWGDVAFSPSAMLDSMLVQASLSLVWTLMALALMVFGHARGRRDAWITGGVLIAVVVAKLFLVELSNHGGLERIISFVGVGVLLLVIGYFAPLPPRRASDEVKI